MNSCCGKRTQRSLCGVVRFSNQPRRSGRIVTRDDRPTRSLNESMALSFRDRMRQNFPNLSVASRERGGHKSDPDAGFRSSRQRGAWIDFQEPVPDRLNQSGGCILDWKNGIRRTSGIDCIEGSLKGIATEKRRLVTQQPASGRRRIRSIFTLYRSLPDLTHLESIAGTGVRHLVPLFRRNRGTRCLTPVTVGGPAFPRRADSCAAYPGNHSSRGVWTVRCRNDARGATSASAHRQCRPDPRQMLGCP